ncbi:MAG: hypothetical protein V4639_16330 [Pseudomonadota bacterium]
MKRSWNTLRDKAAGAWPVRMGVMPPVYARSRVEKPGVHLVLRAIASASGEAEIMSKKCLQPNSCLRNRLLKT